MVYMTEVVGSFMTTALCGKYGFCPSHGNILCNFG